MQTATLTRSRKESLADVLQARLDQEIARGREQSKHALIRIEREGRLLEDFIAPLGGSSTVNFDANGTTAMIVKGAEGDRRFHMHPHAAFQAGEKLGVPGTFVRDLAAGPDWKKELAARILNDHVVNATRQRVLVRTVGDEVRGVLSDQYRRLSSPLLTASFIKAVTSLGGSIINAHADDTRFWIEVLRREIIPIETPKNGTVHLAFGARFSHSDFGDGALDIRFFFKQVICLNGAVTESSMRQIHLGSRLPDDIQMSERTYELDTETQASAIQDITRKLFNRDELIRRGQQIQGASATEVDLAAEVKRLPRIGLTQGESKSVEQVLLKNDPNDGIRGAATLWKLSQAVAAVARDAEGRRRREIEEVAGALMLRKN